MLQNLNIDNLTNNYEVIAVDIMWTDLIFNKIYKVKEIIFINGFNVYQFKLFGMGENAYMIDRFDDDLKKIRNIKLSKILRYVEL